MSARLVEPFMTYFDDSGVPLASGTLTFEVAGSPGTLKDTFPDSLLLETANPNPITLDSAGRVPDSVVDVFGDGNYRMIVKNAAAVEQEVFDPVAGGVGILGVANIAAMTALTKASLSDGDERFISGFATQGDGGQDNFFWDATSAVAANGGTVFASDEGSNGRWFRFPRSFIDAREFGSIGQGGDDSTLVQAAIDFKETLGGIVWFAAGTYLCNNLILKDGVYLNGELGSIASPSGARSAILSANAAGVIVDTAASQALNMGVIGLSFQGSGAGTAVKGVHFDNVLKGVVRNCSFNNFSDEAVKLDSDTGACNIIDNFAQNCLLDRTQAAKIGVLDIDGADHWITRGEYTASLTALSDANAYLCAAVIRGGEHMVDRLVGEISDCGIHVTGVTSNSRFVSCRGDLNWGNGWEIEGSADLATCVALRNGRETDNTYDGFLISAGNGTYNGCLARSLGADAWAQRYGFNDTQASDANKNFYDSTTRSIGHGTESFNFTSAGGAHTTPTGPAKTFTDQDATPSVDNYGTFTVSNTVATSITDFANPTEGQIIEIRATNANTTFVHNATILVTATGQDRVTIANRIYIFKSLNGIWYEKSPRHGWIKHATEHLNVSSGTEIDWTGIPADVVEIKIVYNAHSADAADELSVRLGDSGGFHLTAGDYSGRVRNATAGTEWDTEAPISNAAAAAHITSGTIYITHITGNTWGMNGTATTETVELHVAGGYMDALDTVLSQLRLFMDGGANFDGGGNYVLYHRD